MIQTLARTTLEPGTQNGLPPGWAWTSIGTITKPVEKVNPEESPDMEFTYLDISSIDNTVNRITEPKSYTGRAAPSRARQLVQAHDVLFSTVRTYLKNIAQVPEIYDGQIASTGFAVLRAEEGIVPQYLFYYCLSEEFLTALGKLQRGTSYPAVRDGDVREQTIPLPPTAEQQRIVAAIEQHLTRLDAGVAALRQAQTRLRRYRAAVLKAACEGRLVTQDPSDGLTSSPSSKATASPAGWPRLPLAALVANRRNAIRRGPFGSAIKKAFFVPMGYKVYEQKNAIRHDFTLGSYYIDEKKFQELRDFELLPGDIIISCSGTIGEIAIVPPDAEPGVINQALLKISLDPSKVLPEYFILVFRAYLHDILAGNTRGSAMQNIASVQVLKQAEFPIPSLDEQQRVIEAVDRCYSIIQRIDEIVEENLYRAARLRQAILHQAFTGRLAAQDPTDEPASVLLARIFNRRSERMRESGDDVTQLRLFKA